MAGLGLSKPLADALSRYLSNIRHLGQFFQSRLHELIQAAEGRSQTLSGLRTHLTDAQGEDQPGNILALAGSNGIQQLLGRLGAGFPQAGQLVHGQVIDIRRRADGPLFNKAVHNGAAQALDIHGIPADKMGNVPAQLGGALRTGAAQESPILVPFYGSAADGAFFGSK